MLVSTLMRNLNNNFRKVDSLQNMMASGRKFGHISDDPIALIYSQTARNKLARLSHYQTTVGTAQKWLTQAETGIMELQRTVADAYVSLIDAATNVKTDSDRQNLAKVIAQYRDHFVDTLNTAFGDKFVFGGYNTPGEPANLSYLSDRSLKPFTVENDKLFFNGYDLSVYDGIPAELLNVNLKGLSPADALAALDNVAATITIPGTDPPDLYADLTAVLADINSGRDPADEIDADAIIMLHRLKDDVLTFDVGPGISMPVTINGIDLIMFTTMENGVPVSRNAYTLIDELYKAVMEEDCDIQGLSNMIKELQDAQNHILTKTAEIGGRTRRLELLEARYEQDYLNYEQMKSDAEDADMAEVIMKLRMAEAVMQASMSAGARIIQPSLMDFLR